MYGILEKVFKTEITAESLFLWHVSRRISGKKKITISLTTPNTRLECKHEFSGFY